MRKLIALLVGCLVGLPTIAHAAQERKSPLADAPAVRKRLELRAGRFEAGVGVATTLGQDFYNAVMLNLRAGMHFNDWLGLSVSAGVANLTPNMKSAFHNKLADAVSTATGEADDRTPLAQDVAAAANRIGLVIAPQVDITPFAGKFSIFGKLFMNYDVYVFGGPGFVNLVSRGSFSDGSNCGPSTKCNPVTGMKVGGNVGVGMHAFATNYFAINLELRDLIYKNNPSGRDMTGDGVANDADLSWTHNWMLGMNFTFFLPGTVKTSH